MPITTGRYPDAQLRKIVPLRKQRAATRESLLTTDQSPSDYKELPVEFFLEFDEIYKNALKHCGDLHGYRNPYLVAATMLRTYGEKGILLENTVNDKHKIAQHMAQAAIEYPYMPNNIRVALNVGSEIEDYDSQGPWIRKGTAEFIGSLLGYAEDANSQVLFWTKGDGSYYSNPPYIGAEEQQLRVRISGLEQVLTNLGFFDSARGTFLAHPKKATLLGTRVLPDLCRKTPHVTDIVIVDDSEKNLAEAAQEVRRFDLTPHPINPLDDSTDRTRLELLTEYAHERRWGPNASFIIDMDDTLLHERFRKHHQPRNMAFVLLRALVKK